MNDADRLGALWRWLASWLGPDGGVHGPVVHRSDLKRMFAIHDTPWTQHAVIEGLLHLHRRSGDDRWLATAVRLGDAQCARLAPDGRFRRAGHEDDRFSSLVHNALADCALLALAAALHGDAARRDRYVAAVERNLEEHVVGRLHRPALRGFAMDEVDRYARRDRLVVNMNCVALMALVELDRRRGTDRHAGVVRRTAERILELENPDGLPYSDLQPELQIPIYTGLSLRAAPVLGPDATARAVTSLERLQDPETGLWAHKLERGRVARFPVFVAGAGLICNGLLDAAELTGANVDGPGLAQRLLRFQQAHGAIRNFVGYDHPDNGRPRGRAVESWEDVYATPNWNAQAFHFLCRVLPPPDFDLGATPRAVLRSRRYVTFDSTRASAVVGLWPPSRVFAALYPKRRRHGLVVPAPAAVARAVARRLGRG